MATGGGGGGGDGGGVRGRKRRSPHGLGGHDTILQRLVCPAVYQKETFMFLYDFFMCRASTSPPTSVRPLQLPSSNDYIATHFTLSPPPITTTTDDDAPPAAIPIEQLTEYRYEDGRHETCMEVAARLRSFPNCRIIHERLTSYRIMSYERTLKTITIVMEVAVDVLFRQCRLYLLQEKDDKIAQCVGGVLLTESMRLSYHDVGRMFVGAWRDYVMQSRYGRYHPHQIVLKLHREPVGINVVTYYKERLGIQDIINDDVVLDYYAFECEEIKKGTNLSRLTQSMHQLELGEHVNPWYVSVFRTLYRRMIVEPLQYLRLQNEYTSAVLPSSSVEDSSINNSELSSSSKRGRKQRDPDKNSQLFAEEKRKRALWYRQQQQQYIEEQQRQEEEENQQMLDDILSSLQIPITTAVSSSSSSSSIVPASPPLLSSGGAGYGQYRKNIENCSPSPAAPPPKRCRRRTKNTTMAMMLANIKL